SAIYSPTRRRLAGVTAGVTLSVTALTRREPPVALARASGQRPACRSVVGSAHAFSMRRGRRRIGATVNRTATALSTAPPLHEFKADWEHLEVVTNVGRRRDRSPRSRAQLAPQLDRRPVALFLRSIPEARASSPRHSLGQRSLTLSDGDMMP